MKNFNSQIRQVPVGFLGYPVQTAKVLSGFFYMSKWQCTDGIGKHSNSMGKNEGVYIIFSCDFINRKLKVIYVGRSLNLEQRWKSHAVYRNALKIGLIPSVKWKICTNSAQLEASLIKKFQPKFNKQLL